MGSLGAGIDLSLVLCREDSDLFDQCGGKGVHPVVSCSQPDHDDLVCSVQAVVAVCWFGVRMILMPFSFCCSHLCSILKISPCAPQVRAGGSLRVVLEGAVAAGGNQVVQRKAVLLVASSPVSVYALSLRVRWGQCNVCLNTAQNSLKGICASLSTSSRKSHAL